MAPRGLGSDSCRLVPAPGSAAPWAPAGCGGDTRATPRAKQVGAEPRGEAGASEGQTEPHRRTSSPVWLRYGSGADQPLANSVAQSGEAAAGGEEGFEAELVGKASGDQRACRAADAGWAERGLRARCGPGGWTVRELAQQPGVPKGVLTGSSAAQMSFRAACRPGLRGPPGAWGGQALS